MTELKGRKIEMFRCHLDPAIGPKPRNAFSRKELPNCEFEFTPAGVYVKYVHQVPGTGARKVTEHVVPFANVQSIKFISKEDEDSFAPTPAPSGAAG